MGVIGHECARRLLSVLSRPEHTKSATENYNPWGGTGDRPSSRMSALPDFFGGGIFGFAGWSCVVAVAAGATVMSGIDGEGARDMVLAVIYIYINTRPVVAMVKLYRVGNEALCGPSMFIETRATTALVLARRLNDIILLFTPLFALCCRTRLRYILICSLRLQSVYKCTWTTYV